MSSLPLSSSPEPAQLDPSASSSSSASSPALAPDPYDESIHAQPASQPQLSPIDPDEVYDDPAVSDELGSSSADPAREAAGDYDLESAGDDYADDDGDDGGLGEVEEEERREEELDLEEMGGGEDPDEDPMGAAEDEGEEEARAEDFAEADN